MSTGEDIARMMHDLDTELDRRYNEAIKEAGDLSGVLVPTGGEVFVLYTETAEYGAGLDLESIHATIEGAQAAARQHIAEDTQLGDGKPAPWEETEPGIEWKCAGPYVFTVRLLIGREPLRP